MKSTAALLGLALLAATLTVPTATAEAVDDAPTNVKISWKDSTFKFIHVTWDEATPQPNAVFVRQAGDTRRTRTGYLAVEAPNEFDMRADLLYTWQSVMEIGVVAGTEAGDTSPVVVSQPFDTITPRPATLDSFTMSGTSGLHVKWSTPFAPDPNPGDPLDQPATVLSIPRYTRGDGVRVDLAKASAATELSFTGPAEPFTFIVSATNEWMTTVPGAQVWTMPSQLKATVPARNIYGNTAVITGSVAATPQSRQVVLQARNSATSPWYVVSYYWTLGNIYFDLMPGTGTRQYRVGIASYATKDHAYFGGYSTPVTMTVQQRAKATPQWDGRVNLGRTIPLFLDVQPAVNGAAVLQRWNGKAWTTVGSVPIKNGSGTGYVRPAALGRVAYRYYVPTHTWRGLPVAATYSQQFVVTTIR